MDIIALSGSVTLPAGSLLSLTQDQVDARPGQLIAVDAGKVNKIVAGITSAKKALADHKKAISQGQTSPTKGADKLPEKIDELRASLAEARGLYRAKVGVFFKAGERLGFDGNSNARGVQTALGLDTDAEPKEAAEGANQRARAEGVAAGRAAMLAEVEAYNTALEAVEEAQDAFDAADGDDAKASAKKALEAAEAAAEQLKPMA